MFHLIPPPLHRLMLRAAHRCRNWVRGAFKRRLEGASLVGHDAAGRVLLVRHSYGSGQWSLPGGGCRKNEEPAETIRREIREELGLELVNLEKIALLEEVLSGAPHTAHIFAAELTGEPVPDGREIVAVCFFARDALPPGLSKLTTARLAYWLERAS
jgi:8-oxo-dGTP pyrophosphatase MutT (NUDIX family)